MAISNKNLTLNQQKIIRELAKLNKQSSDAYYSALKVLEDIDNPDRFNQSANSIRHLSALISRQTSIQLDEEEQSALKNEFNQTLIEKGLAEKYKVKIEIQESSLIKKLKKVIIESPRALPTPSQNRINTLFQRLYKIHDYFHKIAHYSDLIVNPVSFDVHLKELENILLDLLEPTQEVIPQLDNFLRLEKPTQKDIEKLISTIKHPSHAQHFFTRLDSPEWIDLLNENLFFSDPKIASTHSFMISIFAPMSYLVKMSFLAPEKVLTVLHGFNNTKNYRLFRSFLSCLTNMPVSVSRKAIDLIKKWMSYYCTVSELVEIKRLIKKSIKEKDSELALSLLAIMLDLNEPIVKVELESITDRISFTFSDFEDFMDELINLEIECKSSKFFNLLCTTLTEKNKLEIIEHYRLNAKIIGGEHKVPPEEILYRDHSSIWRPHLNRYNLRSDKNILVDKIIETLQQLKSTSSDLFTKCLKELSMHKLSIFKRIQLYFYSQQREIFQEEIKEILLNKDILLDEDCWGEMYYALKDIFKLLEENEKKIILEWISEDFDLSQLELSEEQRQERNLSLKKARMKKMLAPILNDLDEGYQKEHSELLTKISSSDSPKPDVVVEPVRIFSPIEDLKKQIHD